MKPLATSVLLLSLVSLQSEEVRMIPASPSLAKLSKEAESAAIVLLCKANAAGDKLVVEAVYKGSREYESIKNRIIEFLPSGDKDALGTKGFRELVFIVRGDERDSFRTTKSIAIWPQRDEIVGEETLRFLSIDLEDLERALIDTNNRENKAEMATPRKPSD